MAYTVFEYLYRDASNFKAYGSILLRGDFSRDQHNELIQSLEGGDFFIAEQVRMPPLYDLLFQFDGGPTGQDHAWHSFDRLRRETAVPQGITAWGDVAELVDSFTRAANDWNPRLSPNFALA